MKYLLAIVTLFILSAASVAAQVTGEPTGSGHGGTVEGGTPIPDDTLFVFEPARPLIDSLGVLTEASDVYGFDLLFSNSGFGAGGFYQHNYSQRLAGFIDLGITGSRKTDEFDQYDASRRDWRVPGKVNRLYTLPLTIGLRYRVFDEVLVDNFRPYINAGVGPSMIVALPYQYEFFSSFGHAKFAFTAGGFVGIGAEIGGSRPVLGVNLRYFYIPLKPGLESIENDPITDFGGLFLTMNVGFMR
jgi:opacity protein-like surface antigen